MTVASEPVPPPAPSASAGANVAAAARSGSDSGSRSRSPEETAPPVPPALHEARALARAHPGDPRALATWAQAALRAGDLREARRAASAWALHDGTVEPRLFMAQVLAASGRRADAVATLNEWLELHPDSTDARSELARLSSAGPGAPRERETAKSGAAGEGPARELARR